MGGGAQMAGRLMRFIVASLVLKMATGPAAWGEIVFAITVMNYASFVLELGLTTYSQIKSNDAVAEDRLFFLAIGPIRFLLTLPLLMGGWWLIAGLKPAGGATLTAYLLLLLLKPWVLDWYCSRKGYYGTVPILQLIRQSILCVLLWTGAVDSVGEVVVADLSLEVFAGLATWFFGPHHAFGSPIPKSADRYLLKNLYKGALPLFFANSLMLLHQNLDIVVIRTYLGLESVGIYDYSYRLVLFAVLGGGAFSSPLRRQLARISEGLLPVSLSRLLGAAHKLLAAMSFIFALFALYGAETFFEIMLDPASRESALQTVRLLSLYVTISFLAVPLGEWLLTHKPHSAYLRMTLLAGLANLGMNLLLVPFWGTLGAALAKVLAETCMLVYLLLIMPAELRKGLRVGALLGLLQAILVCWILTGHAVEWFLPVLHLSLAAFLMYNSGFFRKLSWTPLFMRE